MATAKEAPFLATDMFGPKEAKPDAPTSSLFVKVVPQAAPKSGFPSLSMTQGFSRTAARADAMLVLRIAENQAAKALQPLSDDRKTTFLEAVSREIALKEGVVDAEMAMRDALMARFCTKSS